MIRRPFFRPSLLPVLGIGIAVLGLAAGPAALAQGDDEPRLVEPPTEGRLVEPAEEPRPPEAEQTPPPKPSGPSIGDLRFEAPKGWKALDQGGGIMLLSPDSAPEKGAFIVIAPSEPLGGGDFEAAFVEILHTTHRGKKGVKGTKPAFQKLPGGVQMLAARLEVPEGEGRVTHRMFTAYLHERHIHALMFSAADEASFDRHYPAFRTLAGSLSFGEDGRSGSDRGGESGPAGGERTVSRPGSKGAHDAAPVRHPGAPVKWEDRVTAMNLERGMGVTLEYGEKASGPADLRMTGTHLESDTGEFMAVKGDGSALTVGDMLKKLGPVPPGIYVRSLPIEGNLSNLVILRMRDGRSAKIQFGSVKQALGPVSAEAVFTEVGIEYDLSRPLPGQTRRAPGPLDSRLVGTWKLFVPGGFSPDPVRPGYRPTESFTPGAGSGVITISADGKYRWNRFGKTLTGTLRRIRPGYARPDRKYYAASDGKKEVHVTFTGEKTHYGDGLMVDYAEGKRLK